MTPNTLESLGYEYCEEIQRWRKYQGKSYTSNVIEVVPDTFDSHGNITTAYGFDEWVCKEVKLLMKKTKKDRK